MLPTTISTRTMPALPQSKDSRVAQRVVIVNGSPEILDLLETILDAGHYDVVFVEPSDRAYSCIKHVRPDLIILCVCLADMNGFQVLSMLKLDADTCRIPVLTYTLEFDGEEREAAQEAEQEAEQSADGEARAESELFPSTAARLWMN